MKKGSMQIKEVENANVEYKKVKFWKNYKTHRIQTHACMTISLLFI